MWKWTFLISFTSRWLNAEATPSAFEMSSVVPQTKIVVFKKGGHFTLQCTSSRRWMSCDWSLAGGTSPCLIQHSETSKQCAEGTQATIKTIDEATCSLDVSSMTLDDLGRYRCNLQSFPDEGTSEYHYAKQSFRVVKPSRRAAPQDPQDPSPGPSVSGSNRGYSFQIDDRYPEGRKGEHPTITLRKRAPVVFNCSSTSNWMACTWKSPMSSTPCQLYKDQKDSKKSESCSFGKGQTLLNYDVQYEKKGNLHTCSLKGDLSQDPNLKEEGKWNCYLQSYPSGSNDDFENDHQFFNLELLDPAGVTFKYNKKNSHDSSASHNKKEVEVFEKQQIELECATDGAKPQASINWYLNTEKIDFDHRRFRDYFKHVEKDGPTQNSMGQFSYREKIQYTSAIQHNGHYLQCRSVQLDDEDNLEEVYGEDTKVELFIKDIPVDEAPVISAEIVGTIIGFIIILILAFLLLSFAWYTKRWCFAAPIIVVGATKDKDTGEMIIQTEETKPLMKNSETEASFGPPKPSRSRDNIYNDIEKGEVVDMPDKKELRKPNFSLDQVIVYEFEGDNKSVVSLSSIESGEDQLDGMDWEDTFRSMGPKFCKLAELCEGSDSEEEEEEVERGSDEGVDTLSKKKKAPEVNNGDQVDIGLPKKVGPGEVKSVKAPVKDPMKVPVKAPVQTPVQAPVPALRNKDRHSQNGSVKLKQHLLEGTSEV